MNPQRAGFEDGNGEQGVGAELFDRQGERIGEGAGDDVDPLAVGRKQIETVADFRRVAEAERGLEHGDVGIWGGTVAELDGEFGLVEAVIGEGLAIGLEVGDGEAGFVFEELEIGDDPGDGSRVGGPVEGLGELPGLAGARERVDRAGGVIDGEDADIGGFGAEDATTGFEGGALGAPVALKLEDEEEQRDVEEEQDERDFGAHFLV